MSMVLRCRHNVWYRRMMAVALACTLFLSIAGCQPHRCAVDPPDRVIDAAPELATDLQERITRAFEVPGPITLTIEEDELTALLRQALADTPVRALTLHVTDEALYLQMTIGSDGHWLGARLVPEAEDGLPAMHVSCLTLNDRPLPRLIGAMVESAVSAVAADAAWSLYLESVTLHEGTLLLVVGRHDTPGTTSR